jgi:hypothetical protein
LDGNNAVAVAVELTVAGSRFECAAAVVVDCSWREIARRSVSTSDRADEVTDAIAIKVGRAVASTCAYGVSLVSVAITIAWRDIRTAALERGSNPSADTTFVDLPIALPIAIFALVCVCAVCIGVERTASAQGAVEAVINISVSAASWAAAEIGKVLACDLGADFTVGGELRNENSAICTGQAL